MGSSVFNDTISCVIFRSKRDEVTEGWRRLHSAELYDQHSPLNVIRVLKGSELGGECRMYGVRRGAYRILVGEPEGKRPLGKRRN